MIRQATVNQDMWEAMLKSEDIDVVQNCMLKLILPTIKQKVLP